ncbi:MAG: hypothetical protein ACHP9T_06835 [Caulobacterales bacterium]
MNKVPAVTLAFWIAKTFATTVGETAADYLNQTFHLGLTNTSYIMGGLLAVALLIQFTRHRYVPIVYWIVVVLISVFGTLISDNLVDNFGVPLWVTTGIFSAGLAVVFVWWFLVEHTLSVHTICSTRRELFYWAAILFTFSLGTSAGDLIGEQFGLGYALSLALFAGLIALVAVAFYGFKINSVLAFWAAYILTRPLGASAGDLLSQPTKAGGLGLGTTWTSLSFLVVIAAIAIGMTVHERRQRHSEALSVQPQT